MINPNINCRVRVKVLTENNPKPGLWAEYKGHLLPIYRGYKKPGTRYYWLRYSILTEEFYLVSK